MSVTNDGSGSSEKIASSFMADGRPAAGDNPGTQFSSGLPIANQVPGKSFSEWAINGYKLSGDTKTPGMSDHYVRPEVMEKVPPTPIPVKIKG
jgi:hypothetical protein